MPADHRRVNAPRHVTQLLERQCDLAYRLIQAIHGIGVADKPLLEHAQLEREGDQPLLRSVVEVAFESLPLVLAGLDHSAARALQLLGALSAPREAGRSRARFRPRR